MKITFCIVMFATIITRTSYSQTINEPTRDEERRWLVEQQLRQYDFYKSFKTKKYVCEVKRTTKIKFDIKQRIWEIINDDKGRYTGVGQRKIYKIYKSDDIKKEVKEGKISHCGNNDPPESSDRHLNKYFCIVSQDEFVKTHHKCLLNIVEDYDKRGNYVHTLVCGNEKSTKFNLTYNKIFGHNFIASEFGSGTLSHSMEVEDCQEFGN